MKIDFNTLIATTKKILLSASFFFLGSLFILQVFFWQYTGIIWMTMVTVFLVVPVLDFMVGKNREIGLSIFGRIAAWIPRLYVTLYFGVVALVFSSMNTGSFSEIICTALALGTIGGAVGINLAHELMHRKGQTDRLLSWVVMCSMLYGHFTVEHIRGHHVRVATSKDPATAKRGQTLYSFFLQSIVGSFKHAWKLEGMKFERHRSIFKNKIFLSLTGSSFFLSIIWVVFGLEVLMVYIGSSVWAILLLEATNYIEHYGLLRKKDKNGSYESVGEEHSWNADFSLSNWILLNLPWHSDHHKCMNKHFNHLQSCPSAPQLPFGYPLMIILSFCPVIFIPLMEKRLNTYGF